MARGDSRKSVADIINSAQKKYDLRIGSAGDILEKDVRAISTGSMAIDSAIGVGGLPRGRSCELYGLPASGKTTTAIMTAASEQKRIIAEGTDEYILYLDYEHALDPTFVSSLGLDMSHKSFILAQPETFEQGAEIAKDLIESGEVRVAVWDSVASMVPQSVWDADEGKALIAPLARVLGPFLQKLNPILKNNDCLAIFINHLKEVIDGSPRPAYLGPAKTTPGGKALKFYSSVRLEFTKVKGHKSEVKDVYGETQKIEVASDVKVSVTKNKVGVPFKQAHVRVRFGKGFDDAWSALKVLVGQKKIYGTSGYFYFDRIPALAHLDMDVSGKGQPYLRTEEGVLKFADSHPEWREKFIKYAREVIQDMGVESIVDSFTSDDDDEDDEHGAIPSLQG